MPTLLPVLRLGAVVGLLPPKVERRVLLSELRSLAHEAVDSLPEPDREIFQRYYFLYQKVDEIGARPDFIIDCPKDLCSLF